MDKTKQWGLAAGVGVLAVLVVGWFLLISPQRSRASDLQTRTDTQENVNQQLQQKIDRLAAQHKDLPQVQALLAKLAAQLPDNPALPSLIRQLSTDADSAGVELVSLTPSPPQFVQTTPAASSASGTSSDTSSDTAAGDEPTAATHVATTKSLAYVPIQIVVNGGFFHVEQFLSNIEANHRVLLVTQLDATPKQPERGSDASATTPTSGTGAAGVYDGHLETTITGRVFINVAPAGATAPTSQSAAPTTAK